jgi:hypothetical protein
MTLLFSNMPFYNEISFLTQHPLLVRSRDTTLQCHLTLIVLPTI